LKQGDFNFTLYKDGRQWGSTLKPQINQPLQFKDLPAGNYQVRVNVTNSSKNGHSYKTVFNLDQAGQTLAQARNLGKLTDQKGRLIVNDHVGIPTGDLDYYKFSTDSNRRLLRFAVRHPSGNGSLPLEGNVEFILYDKNGKLLKKVNSANKKAILDTSELAPNSEYYVRIKAHSGNFGNYQLVLNGEVKRNPVQNIILNRAKVWVDRQIPYNQKAWYQGYRQDCSGFVSMAWQLPVSAVTSSLPQYAITLNNKNQLQPGDAINNRGIGNGGHVVLFVRWVDQAKGTFIAYEQNGGYRKAVQTQLTLKTDTKGYYIQEYSGISKPWYLERKKS
ncbi:MAG: hypothetical protein ACRCU2_17485, partial [Planktothrix sp.]